MVSGLVSENTPTSASSTGAFAQPRRSTAINAITHVALAAMSTVIAQTEPTRVDEGTGNRTDCQARRNSGKGQPSGEERRASPCQRVQHDRQREHAPCQPRQQRGEQ